MPRTLLPLASRRGEKTPRPNCPGNTAMIPPPTPLFAGMPTLKIQPPEIVVHAAGAHHAQHLLDITRLQRDDPSDRIHPVVGQTSADHRQIPSRHQDGALPKIQIDHLLGRAIEDPVTEQEVRDRPIAVAGVAFGAIHRLVDLHRPAGVCRKASRIRCIGGASGLLSIRPVVAMAPALIIGFMGRPVPGSRLMELKASPEGSTPTLLSTWSSPRSSSARPR